MARMSKRGTRQKDAKREHWTKLVRNMMETPAWRALPPTAQALYPWFKFEWHGPDANNNGKICLSVRQAAKALGVTKNTAANAIHELQAKGFLVMTRLPSLGLEGAAKSPCFELTEIPLPGLENHSGRRLFNDWRQGHDFDVPRVASNNPTGRNGRDTRLKNHDGTVRETKTKSRNTSQK